MLLRSPAVLGLLAVLTGCAAGPGTTVAPRNTPDEVVDEFLRALDNLDLEAIMETQADDATMFFPHSYATFRANGKGGIHEEMDRALTVGRRAAMARGQTTPPYLGVVANAAERSLQWLGDRGAVVSWVVDRPGNYGRRSAALRLDDDGLWRMVNFHSSNLTGSSSIN